MADQLLIERALDGDGYVLPGATATVYADGTSTQISVYSDVDGATVAANPIVADADGFWPQRYVSEAAKVVVATSAGVTLYTLDPAPTAKGTSSAAADISFTPSVPVPRDNVQDAVDYLASSIVSGFSTYGLGITGNATLRANIDTTNAGAGVTRFDGTTTGTFPTGVSASDTGFVEEWRQSASVAMQELHHATSDRVWRRRMSASTWGAWREMITVNQPLARGDIIRRGASALERLALGASGTVLQSDGTDVVYGAAPSTIVGLLTTTGAATVGPWDLPAGIKRFRISSNASSLSGTGHIIVQLRVSAAFVTSGYTSGSLAGSSGNNTSTAGMIVSLGNASSFWDGFMDFVLHDPATNLWLCTHEGRATSSPDVVRGSGYIALAGAVDGVRINSTAGTFDVASFNINY